ncbi:sensor histidine kinase [soil metagenome]
MGRSLVGRLIWLAAGWSVALLVVAGLSLSFLFNAAETRRFDQGLAEDADSILAGVSVDEAGKVVAPALTDARALLAYSGKYWELAEPDAKGALHASQPSRSLWDTTMPKPAGLYPQLVKGGSRPVFFSAEGPARQRLRVCAITARLPKAATPIVILTAEDRGPLTRDEQQFAAVIAVALMLLGAGLIAAGILQVRVGLRPLFAMQRDVARVRKGGAGRLVGAYPKELSPLAGELNALLDHNQEVVERQRTHVGNLAHALKTPISVMLAEAERTPGALSEVVTRQAGLMRDNVEHHLRRARAAARAPGAGERTPVAPVLDELCRTLGRIFAGHGVDMDCGPDTDLIFLGERQDLQEMAGNLLENACKYSHGQVRAEARPDADPAWMTIVVEDDGPGLTAGQHEAALRRGQRLDESAPGSGLCLSIVDELARAYGGGLTLGLSDELGGLKVELRLPRATA